MASAPRIRDIAAKYVVKTLLLPTRIGIAIGFCFLYICYGLFGLRNFFS